MCHWPGDGEREAETPVWRGGRDREFVSTCPLRASEQLELDLGQPSLRETEVD